MATDTTRPSEVLKLHMDMVNELGELFPVNGINWHTILNKVKMAELLSIADVGEIKTMEDMFICLVQKRNNNITYGKYTNIRELLGSINVFAEEIIDKYTGRIHAFYKDVPTVEINTESYSVKKGQTVVLKCELIKSNTAIVDVQWKRKAKGKDTFTDIEIDDKRYIGGSVKSPSLCITETREEDNEATYICQVKNAAGTGQSDEIRVKITQPEQETGNLETFWALQPETSQRYSQESLVSRFDMATDFTRPQEALDLHTEMVQKLGELFPVNGTNWQIIMNMLQMCNLLPVADADGFKTMNDLFKRLVQKKDNGITYGEYTRIRTILGSCNTFAEEIIDHYTGLIHAFYKGKRKHTHESDSETEAREGNSRRRKRKGKISCDSDSETENEGRESPQRKGKRKHAHESDSETEAREGNSRRRKRKGKISRDSDSETENEGRESPQRKDNLETFLALQPETLQRTSQESHVAKKMTFTSGEDQLTSIKCEEADVKPLYEEKRDVARFIKAVKEGNGADLAEFEALFKNRGFVFEQVSVNPLLIVAAFGSSETVEYIHKWRSSGFDWNDPLEFPAGVFEGILDKIKDRKPTPLHITTFLKNQAATKSLIKYCDEQNIAYCMNNIQLSNSMEEVYMTEFAERLKREYSHLKPAVVPGHQIMENGTWTRVFVAYSPEVTRATNQTRVGIGKVMLRNPYKVDREAMDVAASKNAHCEISKQDMNKAKQAIESHSKTLWCDHSNLNIISISSVRSKREAAVLNKALCVVLYCSTKGVVPLGEKEFPTRLTYGENNFIDIDVREGYFEYGGYENDGYDTRPSSFRHEKLKMGCNIGVMNQKVQNSGGTLGPFVRYNGNTSFLTCAHVLFDVAQQGTVDFTYDGSNRIDVVQPALDTSMASGAACGFIQRAIFNPRMNPSIDMAVVTISDESRLPDKGRFANDHSLRYKKAGFKHLPEYNDGSRVLDFQESGTSNMVVQFGSETHLSKGSLEVDGIQVRPLSTAIGLPQSKDLFCMSGQYEVEGLKSKPDIFMLGDSGAAVFMLNGTSLHCIGMAIGHTSTGNAVVTPIAALLDAVGANADIDLSVFP